MEVLKFRVDGSSEWHEITAIKGERGETGPMGPPGKDGVSGKDGTNGKDGAKGADGYTPVRGTDFWTAEDIAAIEGHCNNYIDSQLGTINEQLASLTEVE